MYKYIVLCLWSGVLGYLNMEEGAECEWEGLKGICVKETRCLTTLDVDSPKHLVCSRKGGEYIICCTDCELVDNTVNAVFSPTSGLYWKDGRKARDSCLQYLEELPYQCKQDGLYGGISRVLDKENNCYMHYVWAVEGEPDKYTKATVEYPFAALLGKGGDPETADWITGGVIISESYIVTLAYDWFLLGWEEHFVAMGFSDSPLTLQIRKVKRFISQPKYRGYIVRHNIALIETHRPIKFNENVLPACLHVEEDAYIENAGLLTINSTVTTYQTIRDNVRMVKVDKFTKEECNAIYGRGLYGYDHRTQMCYGSKMKKTYPYCAVLSGDPLMITTQFSSCVYTAIGVAAFWDGLRCGLSHIPDGYVRIAPYVPWIESIVWP